MKVYPTRLGCSGWIYPDSADKGGCILTRPLRDSDIILNSLTQQRRILPAAFYEKFYSHLTKGAFIRLTRASAEKFQYYIEVRNGYTCKYGKIKIYKFMIRKISGVVK